MDGKLRPTGGVPLGAFLIVSLNTAEYRRAECAVFVKEAEFK